MGRVLLPSEWSLRVVLVAALAWLVTYALLDEVYWWLLLNPRFGTKAIIALLVSRGIASPLTAAARFVGASRARQAVAAIALAVLLVMIAVPPWERRDGRWLGYRPALAPGTYPAELSFGTVDLEPTLARWRLYLQLLMLGVGTAASLWLVGRSRRR